MESDYPKACKSLIKYRVIEAEKELKMLQKEIKVIDLIKMQYMKKYYKEANQTEEQKATNYNKFRVAEINQKSTYEKLKMLVTLKKQYYNLATYFN